MQAAKLALRALACLGSSNCVLLCSESMTTDGSIGSLLEALSSVVETAWVEVADEADSSSSRAAAGKGKAGGSKKFVLAHKGQVAAFLLASTIPWVAPALAGDAVGGQSVLASVKRACDRVCAEWQSPFDCGGTQALFHVSIVHATDDGEDGSVGVAGVGPKGRQGTACSDSLWEACKIAVDLLDTLATSGTFVAPSCMNASWEALAEDLHPDTTPALLSLGQAVADVKALADQGKLGARGRLCAPNGAAVGAGTAQWLIPRFPVFDAETSEECAACATSLTQLEKYTVMGYYRDILQFFDPYLRDDGTKVGTVDLVIAHLQAVSKMLPRGSEAHLEYLLLETMFQLVLQVPTNQTANACCFRVVLDITKKTPGFAPAVAHGFLVLYNLLPEMDASASRELARWLAFQLTNTMLAWPYWEYWAKACSGEGTEGQCLAAKAFCACVLDHCTRNALPERVRLSVPESLHALIPLISSSSAPAVAAPYCPLLHSADVNAGAMAVATVSDDSQLATAFDASKLASVAAKLHEMVSKREAADEVEEWLEALDPDASGLSAELEADHALLVGGGGCSIAYSAAVWRAQLLLHVVLVLGHSEVSSTMSTLASLVDRYSAPLRSLALGQQAESDLGGSGDDAMMRTLVDCLGHEQGYLNMALDILLRRGIMEPAAAARWATSPAALRELSGERDSHWLHAHVEVTVDRALDIVRAATAHRRELGGDMKIDEELLQKPRDMSGQYSMVYPSKQAAASSEGNEADEQSRRDEEEEDDGEGGPSHRRRRGSADEEDMATGTAEQDEEDDPVTLATEAVVRALQSARVVYATVVGRLLVTLLQREEQLLLAAGNDADQLAATDEWTVAATSLLLRVLRSFHGAEAGYLQGADDATAAAILTPAGEVEGALMQAEREGVLETPTADTSSPRAALTLWRSFAAHVAATSRL